MNGSTFSTPAEGKGCRNRMGPIFTKGLAMQCCMDLSVFILFFFWGGCFYLILSNKSLKTAASSSDNLSKKEIFPCKSILVNRDKPVFVITT